MVRPNFFWSASYWALASSAILRVCRSLLIQTWLFGVGSFSGIATFRSTFPRQGCPQSGHVLAVISWLRALTMLLPCASRVNGKKTPDTRIAQAIQGVENFRIIFSPPDVSGLISISRSSQVFLNSVKTNSFGWL